MVLTVGLILLLMLIIFILIIAIYVYTALAYMSIAKRTNTKYPWLAWIPIANIYLLTSVALLPIAIFIWYLVLFIAGLIVYYASFDYALAQPTTWGLIVSYAFFIAGAILMVYVWWKVAQRLNRPEWWGILMIIPIVNFVFLGIMAWGNSGVALKKIAVKSALAKAKKPAKKKK